MYHEGWYRIGNIGQPSRTLYAETGNSAWRTPYCNKKVSSLWPMRRAYTVKTAVSLCELNRHITHFLRVLLQVHELMQRVLPEIRAHFIVEVPETSNLAKRAMRSQSCPCWHFQDHGHSIHYTAADRYPPYWNKNNTLSSEWLLMCCFEKCVIRLACTSAWSVLIRLLRIDCTHVRCIVIYEVKKRV